MGRKNKSYHKSLREQAFDRLITMQAFGESKREAIMNGTFEEKIFSFSTYQTYRKHINYFLAWVGQTYPDCTTLKKAKRYVPEWLQSRVDAGLSAWTIHTEEAAVNKLFQIKPDDPKRFQAPPRRRVDIVRSRGKVVRDKNFSELNNREIINFAKCTGLRRSELCKLRGTDLISREEIEEKILELEKITDRKLTDKEVFRLSMLRESRKFDEKFFVYVRNGKGGRERVAPIYDSDGPCGKAVIDRMRTVGSQKVWINLNTNLDIHSYRSVYATNMYRKIARDPDDIPYDRINKGTGYRYQSEAYVCRGDQAHYRYDRMAMGIVSMALGHSSSRVDVVASHYLRNI